MKRFILTLRDRLWITPALYSAGAILLSLAMFYVDIQFVGEMTDYLPDILFTSVDLAKTIMGGLSSALLTMTTFTFSTIMVVLTTYSSQFSPRTLKNFVQDQMTWRVLGVFMGGFLYNTLSLLFMRDSLYNHMVLSATVGIFIALICLTFFAIFIHHIATSIQVSTLVEELTEDAERVISDYTEMGEQYGRKEAMIAQAAAEWDFHAEVDGYVQWIDFKGLASFAQENKATIEVLVQIGEFIHHDQPAVRLFAAEKPALSINEYIVAGKDRDTRQDPEFALQKLVEVSLRAISPGINDPNTAIHNIRNLGRLMGQLSHISGDYFVFADEDGTDRLCYSLRPFQKVLYQTFFQLRHYGKEDVSVLASITESLIIAAQLSSERVQSDLWKMQLYIIEGMDQNELLSLDRAFYQEKIDELARTTGKETVQLPVGRSARGNEPENELEAKQE